jgi:hypothetical protein
VPRDWYKAAEAVNGSPESLTRVTILPRISLRMV